MILPQEHDVSPEQPADRQLMTISWIEYLGGETVDDVPATDKGGGILYGVCAVFLMTEI